MMRAAAQVGIGQICQASSVNAIGLSNSPAAHIDYLPIDERHPNHAEEAYEPDQGASAEDGLSAAARPKRGR